MNKLASRSVCEGEWRERMSVLSVSLRVTWIHRCQTGSHIWQSIGTDRFDFDNVLLGRVLADRISIGWNKKRGSDVGEIKCR